MTQLIPASLLKRIDKILFIDGIAIGDFCYYQNFFRAFAEKYPHIKIDIWPEEIRRTDDESQWEGLKNYVLYDWLETIPYFRKCYTQTYSPALYEKSIKEAQKEKYPLIVSFRSIQPQNFATLARTLSPEGYIAGIRKRPKFYQWSYHKLYKQLDLVIPFRSNREFPHISDKFADLFKSLFNVTLNHKERIPFIDIPDQWNQNAKEKLMEWENYNPNEPLVLINPFAKFDDRSWRLDRVNALISEMRREERWHKATFIINVIPDKIPEVKASIDAAQLSNVYPFSATKNFFELPAMLAQCDLIISAETSVMHLANMVGVHVIALMRSKNKEWVPYDQENSTVIFTPTRGGRVHQISTEMVLESVKSFKFTK